MIVTFTVEVIPPPVPVTVKVWVPVFTFAPTDTFSVEVPDPGAAMVLGLNFAAARLAVNATDELKPPEIV
jgi:hypothetical protein